MKKKAKKPTMDQFNTKVRKAIDRLNNDATRLKITAAQLATIAALYGDLVTTGTWCYLWELYSGGDATCTPNVIKAVNSLRKQLEKLLATTYDDIPASIWNNDDRSIFGRATGVVSPRTKPGQIIDQCVVGWTQYGGGKMKASCKSTHDQSRASKAANSDGVQIHFDVVDHPPKSATAADGSGIVKLDSVTDPEKCSNRLFFSLSTFKLNLGVENSGRVLLYFIRWYNSKYPNVAGPWMGPYSQNIL